MAEEFQEEMMKQVSPTETEEDVSAGIAVGIDLGTSNSTVAYYQSGKYKYIELSNKRLIPSAIYFKEADEDKWLYGDRALKRGVIYPDALFKHFKRHIGESMQQTFHYEPQGAMKENQEKKYVIDTNIFIEDPFVLDGMGEDVKIIIPKIVYEELERRRTDGKTAEAAETALESINKNLSRIIMEDSHPELLPKDMFQSADKNNNDRNDSKILSVAFFHDASKTVLLSNDKRVSVKAGWLDNHKFQVQNYKEFSFYRNMVECSDSPDELLLSGKDGAVLFLKYLRKEINKRIGYVGNVVITVPQGFSPIQRNEIKEAGYEAGFTDVELRSEPIAAAVAYGLDQKGDKTILIYDFGGGTFDVTILQISDGNFDPLASGGNPELGGEDFTQALIDDFIEKLRYGEILPNEEELDMTDEAASGLAHEEFSKNLLKIWEACEDLKCRLSTSDFEKESIPLYLRPGIREDVEYELTREDFETITVELRAKAKKALDNVLQQADLKRSDIDAVILAGGTSTIPSIAETVERYFGKKPYADRDPATLIAEGAALFADLKWNQNSTIDKKIKVFDKTMTDLGVSLKGRVFDCIIPVGSALPIQKEKIYSLVKDNQEELRIECFTRDAGSKATRTMEDDIRYIGQVLISKLPPLQQDDVDVAVTFQLTKEYELAVDVNLKNKLGCAIENAAVTIDTIGV